MKIIDKIFRDKKSNTLIYIILAVGIVMLVSASSLNKNSFDSEQSPPPADNSGVKMQLERILSDIDGVGEVSVMISTENPSTEQKEESVQSVLVVAEGGKNSEVKEKIIRAVKAALGVETHKIEVFERKEKQ